MNLPELPPEALRQVVAAALAEDLGRAGDVTTDAVVPPGRRVSGRIVAREPLIVAGLPVAEEVFRQLDPGVTFLSRAAEGTSVPLAAALAEVSGPAAPILRGERTALNFLMRMCGIAGATRRCVEEIAGTGAVVLDTRKTAPGLRLLDKYAVAAGGGTNHRRGLYDAVMIKDTHLAAAHGIAGAVRAALAHGHAASSITVEVGTPEQLEEAIAAGAGRALLDNMDLQALRTCVQRARGRIVLEASGGLRPGRLRAVAETGVHALSVGALTHSVKAADVALDLDPAP
ncbi:MAG TPA: carboxylating nicotinate-nucleotide diphosphorylase [Candidatus Polarisedimenticolaceae bacterium]|nr:carboxylating nicotinate-nucleotide diphosphorylase [Candidatus Polarisedimenticolaceae bacterium]